MKRLCTFIRRALCVAALASSAAVAAPGELDVQFGLGFTDSLPGTVVPFSIPGHSVIYGVAVQDDLKIVAAGASRIGSASSDITLARVRVDGRPDPDFGSGGLVITPMPGFTPPCAMAMQPDGRILVTAAGAMDAAQRMIVLLRYTQNGALDPSFGSGGRVFAGNPQVENYGRAVSVLPDGKILVAAGSQLFNPLLKNYSFQDVLLCRFNADGTPDTGFGNAGVATLRDATPASMVVHTDGKIVLAGNVRAMPGAGRSWLARCLPGGALDPSFGNNGVLVLPPPPGISFSDLSTVAVQRDGKVVAAGRAAMESPGTQWDFFVRRFNTDGSPDLAFNGKGWVATDFTSGNHLSLDFADALAVQADGKLLAAGSVTSRSGLVRYLADGSLDTAFGTGGIVITNMQEGGSSTTVIALQADGRIITAGSSRPPSSSDPAMALARYLARNGPDNLAVEWPPGVPLKNGQTVELGLASPNNSQTLETVVRIRNTGAVSLMGLSAGITGAGAARFTIVSPPPPVLDPGASTALTIRFSPAAEISSFGALLTLRVDSPGISEFLMALHGSTDHPVAVLSLFDGTIPVARGDTVDFGRVFPSPAATRIFTIKNTGNIELLVQGITLGTAGTPQDFTAGPPQTDVLQGGGGSTTFSVTFSPTGTGPRTAKLRIASTDTFNPPYEITLSGTLAPGFPAWRQAHFGTTLNEGPAASLSDPDHDGIPNLLEYAALTSPVTPGGIPARVEMNGNILQYTVIGPSGTVDELTYALEWSDSPHLSWNTTGVTASPGPDDGTQQQFQFSVPAGPSGKRFVRLRVTER